jgi:hypothetical protein
MQLITRGKPFHRRHPLFHGGGQGQARQHRPAADVHGAGTALAPVATLLRACDTETFPQRVQQRHAGIDIQMFCPAVDFE